LANNASQTIKFDCRFVAAIHWVFGAVRLDNWLKARFM
jgi:hypothetical protein